MIPDRVLLRSQAHCCSCAIDADVIKIHAVKLTITIRSLHCHGHNVESTCLSCSIRSQKTEYFSSSNTESVLINCSNSIFVYFDKVVCLNQILVPLVISLLSIVPNLLGELSELLDIGSLIKLHSLDYPMGIAIKSTVVNSSQIVNQDIQSNVYHTLNE